MPRDQAGGPFGSYTQAAPSAPTIATLLEIHRTAPGFDAMRLGLSLAIICFHSLLVCYGKAYQDGVVIMGPFRPLVLAILPVFFALSGFLIAGSMLRVKPLKIFIAHRVLRIVPALFCETMISALVLGPLLTTLTLEAYFRHRDFLRVLQQYRWPHPVYSAGPLRRQSVSEYRQRTALDDPRRT